MCSQEACVPDSHKEGSRLQTQEMDRSGGVAQVIVSRHVLELVDGMIIHPMSSFILVSHPSVNPSLTLILLIHPACVADLPITLAHVATCRGGSRFNTLTISLVSKPNDRAILVTNIPSKVTLLSLTLFREGIGVDEVKEWLSKTFVGEKLPINNIPEVNRAPNEVVIVHLMVFIIEQSKLANPFFHCFFARYEVLPPSVPSSFAYCRRIIVG
uniref:Uncharacterized protein n=1 Tax=Tanacetum cinerariifolium TaxID=118510 RepID=A0A699KU64_TANCI|nr:hypothetical protein [Tanacetum cinerariifolium]